MGLRIPFVEHDDDMRYTLSRLLRDFDYDFVTAPDYQTACRILDASPFDVLLSDIRLPDGDGCDLAMKAKSKQSLVAIALTALGTVQDEQRAASCGFDHYFVKPVDFHCLRFVLDEISPQ